MAGQQTYSTAKSTRLIATIGRRKEIDIPLLVKITVTVVYLRTADKIADAQIVARKNCLTSSTLRTKIGRQMAPLPRIKPSVRKNRRATRRTPLVRIDKVGLGQLSRRQLPPQHRILLPRPPAQRLRIDTTYRHTLQRLPPLSRFPSPPQRPTPRPLRPIVMVRLSEFIETAHLNLHLRPLPSLLSAHCITTALLRCLEIIKKRPIPLRPPIVHYLKIPRLQSHFPHLSHNRQTKQPTRQNNTRRPRNIYIAHNTPSIALLHHQASRDSRGIGRGLRADSLPPKPQEAAQGVMPRSRAGARRE